MAKRPGLLSIPSQALDSVWKYKSHIQIIKKYIQNYKYVMLNYCALYRYNDNGKTDRNKQ